MASTGKVSVPSHVGRADLRLPRPRRPADDDRESVDRRGQDEPAVIVGVVAQQLHPRRGPAER